MHIIDRVVGGFRRDAKIAQTDDVQRSKHNGDARESRVPVINCCIQFVSTWEPDFEVLG